MPDPTDRIGSDLRRQKTWFRFEEAKFASYADRGAFAEGPTAVALASATKTKFRCSTPMQVGDVGARALVVAHKEIDNDLELQRTESGGREGGSGGREAREESGRTKGTRGRDGSS